MKQIDESTNELKPRETGSLEWRTERGEMGQGN